MAIAIEIDVVVHGRRMFHENGMLRGLIPNVVSS